MKFQFVAAALIVVAAISNFQVAAQDVQKGKSLYVSHCLRCHGRNMVTPGTVFYDLRQFPDNDKPRFIESVIKGKKTMPAWGEKLTPQQIDDLWAYVLTRGK
jgi:mono/diheme cytochrome c family protein